MFCDGCQRSVPNDAVFCIYCATPVGVASVPAVRVVQEPATGPTVRLQPSDVRKVFPRVQGVYVAPAKPHKQHTQQKQRPRKQHADHSFPVFIIGILFLIAIGNIWPGILVVIGLARFMKQQARGRPNRALRKLVFWGGLAALVTLWSTPFLWPCVVLLLFASHMIGKQRQVGWI